MKVQPHLDPIVHAPKRLQLRAKATCAVATGTSNGRAAWDGRSVLSVTRRVAAVLRHRPAVADALVAAVFAVGGIASLYAGFEVQRRSVPSFHEPAKVVPILAVLAVTFPLALRRRFPLVVATAVIVAFVLDRALLSDSEKEQFGLTAWACWLALYSAAVHPRRTRFWTVALGALAAVLVLEIAGEFFLNADLRGLPLTQSTLFVYNVAVVVGLPLLLGLAVRALRERERRLMAQAAELRRQREENARRAVLDERVRIARELHDVVAHHVSVMGIEAGAARRVMARRPEQAEEILSSIEASSRQAVDELHRLLGFLRRAEQPDELAPRPDLTRLDELVAHAAEGGLSVELVVDGERRSLPATLELSAYRVIQEALTNAVKHSGGTRATVRLDYQPAALEIDVVDDGEDGAAHQRTPTGGLGLVGMRERVGLHGGSLRAGPREHDGFGVHASFPLNGQRS
jgi:signal transduction histidine kinase